ncbi:hypothetical protein GGS23DRAFT_583821 [Durotheca rogersii]|uniref:uncharacterized protein n=1 Tax=Durotheca rogersii TaxID=419775 RepID=UPI00222065E3|nr:uncharacterized protein GGS23DRAFT_583821 [Durotheca rogersii]KAI5859831.1 hypothetical protein GGS23DRAFT_583821 [Durotheca rogersii]
MLPEPTPTSYLCSHISRWQSCQIEFQYLGALKMRWGTWVFLMEDYIVRKLLRSPTFLRGVQRIHRIVHDYKHGRDPNEPLRAGEATRLPRTSRLQQFFSHFIHELRSQVRGTTNQPPKK